MSPRIFSCRVSFCSSCSLEMSTPTTYALALNLTWVAEPHPASSNLMWLLPCRKELAISPTSTQTPAQVGVIDEEGVIALSSKSRIGHLANNTIWLAACRGWPGFGYGQG